MIGYLEGDAVAENCIVTSGGVGYAVVCAHPPKVGDRVQLWVHTAVRENAITLYGFADQLERALFDALCKVQGVGPAVAMALLRDVGAAEVVAAVRGTDAKTLTAAAGVGAKAAEKICANVRLGSEFDVLAASVDVPVDDDLVAVLEGLGFPRVDALEAARTAVGADDSQRLASALSQLRTAA